MEDIRESLKQDTENAEECTGMKHDGKEESVHQDLEERENTMDTDDGTNRIGQMSKLLLFGKFFGSLELLEADVWQLEQMYTF